MPGDLATAIGLHYRSGARAEQVACIGIGAEGIDGHMLQEPEFIRGSLIPRRCKCLHLLISLGIVGCAELAN